MYFSGKLACLRNLLVAIASGSITLVILLIAPLGLAAVIANTVLVTLTVYGCSDLADRTFKWLYPTRTPEILSSSVSSVLSRDRAPILTRRRG